METPEDFDDALLEMYNEYVFDCREHGSVPVDFTEWLLTVPCPLVDPDLV